MATLYDVCKKTGFSTATVSRVINGSGLVKEATRQRVLEAIEELNYRPSAAAQMLAGRKTDTIGVVMPLLDDGFYVQVLRGIDHVATQENLKLLISFYHSDADFAKILSSLSGEGRTDAIIVSNHTSHQPEMMRELTGDDMPIALIAQNHENNRAMDSVLFDNYRGAYSAVRHLLESKPKTLLLLTGPECITDSQERLAGAQQAIREASYEVDVITLTGNFYREDGYRVFEEHVRQKGAFPDAVFAFNDAMAFGVLDVLRDASRQVPEDVQVIGFDGTVLAQSLGLSSVRVPMRQLGEEAVRLVAKRIRDKDEKPNTIFLETELVVRDTTTRQSDAISNS